METAPVKFPVLAALGGRRTSTLRDVAAAAALVVIWAALWTWLVLGVGVPTAASVRRLSPPAGPATELALRGAGASLRAP